MDVQETSLLEELVGGVGQVVTDAGYGAVGVGTGTQMCDFTKILVSVSLLG